MITKDQVEKLERFANTLPLGGVTAEEFLKDYEDSKWVIYDKNNTATLPPMMIGCAEYSVNILSENLNALYYDYQYKDWYTLEKDSATEAPKKWKLLE